MTKEKKKRVMSGLDYVRDARWSPKVVTRKQAKRLAERMAKRRMPTGFWTGLVVDCGDYWRISMGGK